MYHIPAYTTGVTLFMRNGDVRTFKSFRAAMSALGYRWICEHVRAEFRTFDGYEPYFAEAYPAQVPRYHYADAIMRDDHGQAVVAEHFRELRAERNRPYRWWRFEYWNGEGPVPGTGNGGYRRGRYFRKLHTTGERRQSQRIDADEPAPRAARNLRNIPNSWDDYPNTSRGVRSWKRFRKTRWK